MYIFEFKLNFNIYQGISKIFQYISKFFKEIQGKIIIITINLLKA